MTMQELNQLSNIDIETVERNTLADIQSIKLNNKLSKTERFLNYLNAVKNPYCFRCEDIAVKISFSPTARTLEELFTDFLIKKKQDSRI